jgi:membrane associated rhomboid family serine protease
MKKLFILLPVCAALTMTGCSNMNTTQQRELSGGAIGAAAGAGITAIAGGNPIWGAIGGAAVGVLGGYIYDKNQKGN